MLSVSNQQVHRYLQRNDSAFVESILTEVREQHPAWRVTDTMLTEQIRVGLSRARSHGLSSDRDLSEFVLVMCEVAPNFDQQKDIRAALTDPGLPPPQRWKRLFTPEFDAAWGEADDPAFLDVDAWFAQPPQDLAHASLPDAAEWAEWLAAARSGRGAEAREPTDDEMRGAYASLLARVEGPR